MAKAKRVTDLAAAPPSEQEGREWSEGIDGRATLSAKTRKEITSLDELLEFFEVNQEEWEVEKWVCNQWQVGAKNDDQEITVTPLYQVKAWFRRRKEFCRIREDIEQLVADAKKDLRKAPKLKTPRRSKSKKDFLFVPSIMDPHFGKLCWGRETGWENYDIDTAAELVDAAIADLLDKAALYPLAEILFPIGNDFFHVDTEANTTTAGTRQDVDGRWQKAYRAGRRLVQRQILQLREVAPVKVIIVPGNHDEQRVFCLGDCLEAVFDSVSHVEVDAGPSTRKYHRFDKVLLGFDHGKEMPLKRLAAVQQIERRKDWGETRWNEWLIGHWHKKGEAMFMPVEEEQGVRIRTIPSLTPPDAWHAKSGWIGSVRAAEGLIYHRELGHRAQFTFTP